MTFMLLALACLLSVCMFGTFDILSFTLGRTGWRRFLSTFLLFYAQIIGTEFVLGLTSLLYSYILALLNIILTTAVIGIIYKKSGKAIFKKYWQNLRTFPVVIKTAAKEDRLLTILYVLAGIFLLWVLFLGLLFPAVDWDGNAYHLTYAADLVQNHKLYDVPSSIIWVAAYPKGGEFLQAWTILLSHNDTLADLTQVPFAILGICSLYAIGRSLGVSKRSARYAALLFAFVPSALNQLTTGYIDVMLATTFFAALALVLQKTYRKLDLLLIGITFSLLIAIKTSGIYMVAMLLILLLWNLYRQYGFTVRRYLSIAPLVLTPIIFGLYWYIKNWILYGSPIYPFGLQLAGKTLFKGINYAQWSASVGSSMPHDPFIRFWYTWSEHAPDPSQFRYDYDSSYFGLGPIWFVVLVPAMLLSIYFAIKRRHYYFLTALLFLFGLLMVYPVNFSPRYTMFILSAGIIGLGLVLDNLHRFSVRFTKTVVLILAIVTLGVNFVLWSYSPHTVHNQLSNIRAGRGEHAPDSIYAINFGSAYDFMHNTMRQHQTVVYTAGNWIYPLWNDRFSNKVVYVNATTERAWYAQVKAQKADFIFTTTDHSIRENRWAADTFKQVIYKDAGYEIFKVN